MIILNLTFVCPFFLSIKRVKINNSYVMVLLERLLCLRRSWFSITTTGRKCGILSEADLLKENVNEMIGF